jgi:hypothetical protein
MQYTAPIFMGGLVRWLVELRTKPRSGKEDVDEAAEIAKSETGPGLLLASGYIAGGTLAGVVIAIMQLPFFAPETAFGAGDKVLVQIEGASHRGIVESVDKEAETAVVELETEGKGIVTPFTDLTKLPVIENDWVPWSVFIALMVLLALIAMRRLRPTPAVETRPAKK